MPPLRNLPGCLRQFKIRNYRLWQAEKIKPTWLLSGYPATVQSRTTFAWWEVRLFAAKGFEICVKMLRYFTSITFRGLGKVFWTTWHSPVSWYICICISANCFCLPLGIAWLASLKGRMSGDERGQPSRFFRHWQHAIWPKHTSPLSSSSWANWHIVS